MVIKYRSETSDIQMDTKRDRYAGGNSILAERAVIGLNESATRKVIRAQQADRPGDDASRSTMNGRMWA
jgi:hypothetical protein